MRLFEILKATDSVEQRVIKTIRFNARIIQKMEGKSHFEAVYWSIRTLLDSLRTQERGECSRKIVIWIVEKRYPQHLQNVLRYSAWINSHDEASGTLAADVETKGTEL